ncbi:MAG TPA: methyltransferase [Phycisphaerae bacterium]|nr:methyltransferase [Phycisphaerae bacterium]HRR84667.1 methyltransferase [Phycisphaerae bacterium]
MSKQWTNEQILDLARAYQPACVIAAAADLDLFTVIADQEMAADTLAGRLQVDTRALTVLLDALASIGLLNKRHGKYRTPAEVSAALSQDGPRSVLPMVQHTANCMRRWAHLARVVKTGRPAERTPSIRGEAADQAAFIGAMHVVSEPVADRVVSDIHPPPFKHLLDIGGASGTWTMAFLRLDPQATATIFDLPEVIPMAEQRLREAGFAERVRLAPGDFYVDKLPAGADLVWLSAIAHQNSRRQNRELFAGIHDALIPGGTLLLRDVVMNDDHTAPPGGAMFAVNMLVNTEGGGTYSLSEYRQDLEASGFKDVRLLREDPWMNSVIRASRN